MHDEVGITWCPVVPILVADAALEPPSLRGAGGQRQVDQRLSNLAVQGRTGEGRRHRQVRVDRVGQEILVLLEDPVTHAAAQPRSLRDVVSGIEVQIVGFVVRSQAHPPETEVVKTRVGIGPGRRPLGRRSGRLVGKDILPGQRVVIVTEERAQVTEAGLTLLPLVGPGQIHLVGGVVDGLGQNHRRRIAAVDAEQPGGGLEPFAPLVVHSDGEGPAPAEMHPRPRPEPVALMLDRHVLEIGIQGGECLNVVGRTPAGRQRQLVRPYAVVWGAGVVQPKVRDLVVSELEVVISLPPVVQLQIPGLEPEVTASDPKIAILRYVLAPAGVEVDVADRVRPLRLEPGILAELERIVADIERSQLDGVLENDFLFLLFAFFHRLQGEAAFLSGDHVHIEQSSRHHRRCRYSSAHGALPLPEADRPGGGSD